MRDPQATALGQNRAAAEVISSGHRRFVNYDKSRETMGNMKHRGLEYTIHRDLADGLGRITEARTPARCR